MREKGFTLVELMIVVAIIAILAAVAVTQYSSYKNKAKAKELIGIARSCAMEIVSQCEVDPNLNGTDNLEACDEGNYQSGTRYLTSIGITVTFNGCDQDISVTANGTIQGSGKTGAAQCDVPYDTNAGSYREVECTLTVS